MNPMPSMRGNRDDHFLWTTLTAFAGLLLVGALTVFNHVELARLSAAAPAETQEARFQALAAQLTELAQEVEAFRKPVDSVPLARYDAERENVEQRLVAIEQALSEHPDDDWPSLRDRLARLEEEWIQHAMNPPVTPPVAPPPASSNPSPPPRIAEPSFRLIGIERRTEERFLTILPKGTDTLSQVRLLCVGDQADGWQLDAIEEEGGVFSRGGRKHRLSLTGGKK